jgi:citrate/tricarballylate utilization protein
MLFMAGLGGLALMLARQTPALAIMLSIHLGVVFGLFLSMPYGKFVHGLYRSGALFRYAMERKYEKPLGADTRR